jgi:hypothetical protein
MGVDKPEPKTARVEEKKPYYESFAAGTQNYMNSISSTPE